MADTNTPLAATFNGQMGDAGLTIRKIKVLATLLQDYGDDRDLDSDDMRIVGYIIGDYAELAEKLVAQAELSGVARA